MNCLLPQARSSVGLLPHHRTWPRDHKVAAPLLHHQPHNYPDQPLSRFPLRSRRKSFRSFRNPRVQTVSLKREIDQNLTDFPTQVQEMGGLEIPLVLSCPSELEPHYHQHCTSGGCHHNHNYTMINTVSRGVDKWSKLTSAPCWCAPWSGPQIQEGRPHLYSWGKTNVNRNISLYKLKQHRSLPLLLVTTQWTTTP